MDKPSSEGGPEPHGNAMDGATPLPTGERFSFNFYKHWTQILLRQPREEPVVTLSRDEVTQGDTLSMVLYGITLDLLIGGTFYSGAIIDGTILRRQCYIKWDGGQE